MSLARRCIVSPADSETGSCALVASAYCTTSEPAETMVQGKTLMPSFLRKGRLSLSAKKTLQLVETYTEVSESFLGKKVGKQTHYAVYRKHGGIDYFLIPFLNGRGFSQSYLYCKGMVYDADRLCKVGYNLFKQRLALFKQRLALFGQCPQGHVDER